MLAVLLPLFDENMVVSSYSLFSQKENILKNPMLTATGINDSVGQIDGLEIIDNVGMNTLSSDKEIFVPLTNVSIFTNLGEKCSAPHSRIVLLIDPSVKPEKMYVERIVALKSSGYKFAMRKLKVADFENYKPILSKIDYIFLDYTKIDINLAKIYFSKVYPNINLIAENIQTNDDFDTLKATGGYHLYEGPFYRTPVSKGESKVAPIKMNYINLLNTVNEPDFDLTDAADIISKDTSLAISLLKIANRLSINSEITSIKHATSMLGQRELKKWITTAVTKELCFDKPNEITRLSLLRARFAENLAEIFDLKIKAPELFILGLFSMIDIILSKPMEQAVGMLNLSKDIKLALVERKGPLYPVLYFIENYEAANFNEIDRLEIVDNLDTAKVYDAYKESLVWYRDLFI